MKEWPPAARCVATGSFVCVRYPDKKRIRVGGIERWRWGIVTCEDEMFMRARYPKSERNCYFQAIRWKDENIGISIM